MKKKEKLLRSKQMAKNKSKSNTGIGPVLTEFKSPLANISKEEREKIIDGIGSESKKEFEISLKKLNQILRKYNPITILSIVSGYSLTVGVSDQGVKSNETPDSTHQFQVEILQALILQIDEVDIGKEPTDPKVVQDVIDELKVLGRTFSFSRMTSEITKFGEEEKAIQQIQESVRSYTQAVRNWGYFSQVKTISTELYSYFDKELLDKTGVSATNIIDVFDFMLSSNEESLTARHQILQRIRRQKYTKDQLYIYADLVGQDREDINNLLKNESIPKLANQSTFAFILSHYDLQMSDLYIFNIKDISNSINITEEQTAIILNSFSYPLGGLKKHKTEYIFLDNPVWEKPLIRLTDSEYFCSLPQVFFSFILLSLNTYIEGVNNKILIKRRASYLENKIEEIVKRKFPNALTVSGVKWKFNNVLYETDLISFIDSHAIIIEAKSHKITKPALRGAPERIKRHIKEIIIEPSIQSHRFEEYLNELCNDKNKTDEFLQQQLPVNLKNIKKIIRVSVSLENFTVIQTNLGSLKNTGWIPDNLNLCPSMNLADFETLFDLLEHPVQIIHYLTQRTFLQNKIDFVGDELDFLGLYLTTLLNMGNLQDIKVGQFIISQMSTPIDEYYTSKDEGILIPKPQPKTSKLFQEILTKLEERSSPRWTEIGVLLNMLTPDDQVKLESSIRKYKKIVNRTWEKEDHINTILYVPPSTSTDISLVYLLFKNENSNRRDEFIQNAIDLALKPNHVQQCLIIAKNIDDDSLPYHFIALTEKNT